MSGRYEVPLLERPQTKKQGTSPVSASTRPVRGVTRQPISACEGSLRAVPDDPGRAVGGDLILRITFCPRVVAPVVRRRSKCAQAIALPLPSSSGGTNMATDNEDRTYFLSYGSCTGQCRVTAGGGAGVGKRGEACTSRTHEGNNAHPPPLSMDMLFWIPLCPPRCDPFVLLLLSETGQPQQMLLSRSAAQCGHTSASTVHACL